jgi:hypothetical protein
MGRGQKATARTSLSARSGTSRRAQKLGLRMPAKVSFPPTHFRAASARRGHWPSMAKGSFLSAIHLARAAPAAAHAGWLAVRSRDSASSDGAITIASWPVASSWKSQPGAVFTRSANWPNEPLGGEVQAM